MSDVDTETTTMTPFQSWRAEQDAARADRRARAELSAEEEAQRRREVERAEEIRARRGRPRRPPGGTKTAGLVFPARSSGQVLLSRETTAAVDLVRLQLNRHARGLSKSRRQRVETAVADLEAALVDGSGKTGG